MSRPENKQTIEEIVEEVRDENSDPTTRRETFELDLMEQHRVEEGGETQVSDDPTEPKKR